jgi:branched-chain amino acid transport system permease protein
VIPVINFPLSNISPLLDPAQYQRMLFGLILIFMMIYRQNGLIPATRRKHGKVEIEPTAKATKTAEVKNGAA